MDWWVWLIIGVTVWMVVMVTAVFAFVMIKFNKAEKSIDDFDKDIRRVRKWERE